jgi:hypothetical protein
MKRKRISLNEELKKLSEITSLLKEAGPAQGAQQPAQQQAQQGTQTQQQGQRAPQQNQPAPQQAGAIQLNPQNIEKTMDQGMNSLIQQLPNILKNFTATAGDKDGQLDVVGQQQPQAQQQPQTQKQAPVKEGIQLRELKFDENKFKSHLDGAISEGGIVGLVASAPAIMNLGGKLIGWTGKKVNSNLMQKWGKSVADAGHKLHHKYIGALEKVIAPFMKNNSKEDVHKAAEAMFITLVAGLFAGGLTSPDLLTGIKGQELASYVKNMAPKVMGNLGFA